MQAGVRQRDTLTIDDVSATVGPDGVDAAQADGCHATRARRWRRSWAVLTAVVVALVFVPFVVGAVSLVQNATSLRDVFGDRAVITFTAGDAWKAPVLLGPYSRFYWHHPGPIYFYVLNFWSLLFGGQVFGLALGATAINATSATGILVVAHRRGGRPLLIWTAVALVFYLVAIDPVVFDIWNPSVTLLPFALTLLLAWSLACGDWWSLPWLALTATFVVQTHVGLVPGVVTACVVGGVGAVTRQRRARAVARADDDVQIRRALLVSAAVAFVLWLPPVIQEFTSPDGNLTDLAQFFSRSGSSHTLSDGLLRTALDSTLIVRAIVEPVRLRTDAQQGLALGLVVTAIAFAVALLLARKARSTGATLLLALVGLELVCAVYSVTRIVGAIEFYLVQWITVVGFVLWVAVGNAAIAWARTSGGVGSWRAAGTIGAIVLLATVGVGAARASSPDVKEANEVLSQPENQALFGQVPLRALLRATRPGERVVVRLDSESAWEIMAADAVLLRGHGRDVAVVDSPATHLLFDDTMLVPRSTEATTLAFHEAPTKGRKRVDRGAPLVARQGRWRIVDVTGK